MNATSFKIYNASAGSGKTFTLVKNYLSILLSSNYAEGFKNILAITFTNKAVGEMKERIVDNLADFAHNKHAQDHNHMFKMLCEELGIDCLTLQRRSQKALKKILHNYAFFDVSTIDKFNHRIIRTFAFDLKLPQNFEVTLDTDLLLKEAVDNLIANAGEDKELTELLVNFVIEKIDEDKSWDISRDILETSKKITQENHYLPLLKLKDKSIADFNSLKKQVANSIQTLSDKIKKEASTVLEDISNAGLEFSDFSRSSLPNHFLKHRNLEYGQNPYGTKLEENIAQGKGIIPTKLDKAKAATIEDMLPKIGLSFATIKNDYYHWKFLKNIYKNLVPLTVINRVQNELQKIKEEENLVLISEFNATISETIKGQPAPFIYERLGEKFRHYFIDEFQDTSEMQWQNLVPLIDNALVSETVSGKKGSLLLVGDAKQAIYRWRGGNPEQFVNLFSEKENPFTVPVTNANLDTNFRSYDAIINFNNAFFSYAKESLLTEEHKELYALGHQKANTKKGGLVTVSFIEPDKETPTNNLYVSKTLETIDKLTKEGVPLKDIAILTRTNVQGVLLANSLTEEKIPMVSSETLLLKNSPKIQFLNNLLKFGLFEDNTELKAQLLLYLGLSQNQEGCHSFINNRVQLPNEEAFASYNFSLKVFLNKPFYDAVLYAIYQFNLADASDAYLQYYLDKIQEFSQDHKEGLTAFLNYWEEKGDRLSLVAPEGIDAISIFTIHKSKGLEFPVVIYPFADDKLVSDRNELWAPMNPEEYGGFENVLVSANKDFSEYSPANALLKTALDSKSTLDTFNVIYVAFTRAVSQLHIISNFKDYDNTLSRLLKNFVTKEKQEVALYNEVYGTPLYIPSKEKETKFNQKTIPFGKATAQKQWNIVTKNGMLWDTHQQEAIEKGNIIHQLLSWVPNVQKIDLAIEQAITEGLFNTNEADAFKLLLLEITEHEELKEFFQSSEYIVYNEKEIITKTGEILIPDRLMLHDDNAIIIDYKTGEVNNAYYRQLGKYGDAISEMGYKNIAKKLVYIYPEIRIVEV
ncbi:ATP-dependent helicase [Neptunitalea chrysea]|uniref:DNA 3'-5' helicase n=1 Tax=Neptunitalea chrysea TaxID=1647581 RepID=A0A9W6EVM3_9FLAO|nr:UvrD-helicase domain-containing protein [Neptunitalea chrysea]GLB53106.1 ATP-dependent helicase [Neptunitalea chrysea]